MNNNKQINRVVTPIKLDLNGNKIEEEKVVVKENKTKKKLSINTIMIIFLGLIMVLLIVFLTMVVIPEFIKSSNPNNYYNDATTSNSARYLVQEAKLSSETYLESGSYKAGEYNIVVINNGVNNSLVINNKTVLNASNILSKVGLVHNLLAVATNDNNLFILNIYDNEGNIVKTIDSVTDKELNIESVIFQGEGIVLTASRLKDNKILYLGEELDPCNDSILTDKAITNKTIIVANYELKYKGNLEFDELRLLSKVSVGELKSNVC